MMSKSQRLQTIALLALLVVAFLGMESSRATYQLTKWYQPKLATVTTLTPTQVELNQILQRAMWDVPLVSQYEHFVYKSGPAETTNCHNPEGYSQVHNIQAFDALHAEFIKSGGHHVLCVRAGDTTQVDETWQSLQFASDLIPELNRQRQVAISTEGDAYRVAMNREVAELAGYQYKFGSPGITDCEKLDGYTALRSEAVMVRKAQTPATVCIIPPATMNAIHPVAYYLE